ncbi:MAG: replicative DNA helicase [Caulobacterales bacterium]|nr:replicative DNA helicase [Caulobacterales bacterium]
MNAVSTFADATSIPSMPHNLEAEQALLGALMFDNAVFERLSDRLRGAHFYEPFHQRLFDAIEDHIRQGLLADPAILMERFKQDPAFQEFGGLRYLADLVDRAPPAANAPDYARLVYDLALRRDLIRIGGDIIKDAPDPETQALDKIEQAEQSLYNLAETGAPSSGFVSFSAALAGAVEMAGEAYQRDGKLAGLATALDDLDQKLGGLHPSDLLILAGRPSMGKAQPLDAKVLTEGGWKLMGDLRLGDRLASHDGRTSMISGVFPQGSKQIFRVTFSDGRSTECCAEHLWRVHFRGWRQPRVLSTGDIAEKLTRIRYRGRLWIDPFLGDFGSDAALPVDPWVLGALIGDAKLSGGSAVFSSADASMLEEMEARLGTDFAVRAAGGYDHRIVQSAPHRKKGVQGVSPNPLKDALIGLGLWDVRSEAKFIPAPYLKASRADRLALLRGLIDTDGWVERWGSLRFCTSSERLAADVQVLVRSLGGVCTIAAKPTTYAYKGERRQGLGAYVCNIQHSDASLFAGLERKRSRLVERRRQKRITFASIEPSRMAQAQCIAVTHPDRTYVTDDFIVTHNTALATNIAFNIARNYTWEPTPEGRKTRSGGVVAFYSLEMSAEQLAMRILADASGVSSDKLRKGEIDATDFGRIRDAAVEIGESPLYIDATGGLSISKLAARARRLKRMEHGLDLIIVDYLQLVTTGDSNSQKNRVQEVSEITGGLKALAKELSVPIIALSQLSRQVESREDKRPQLSDLRESGSIEQDADCVMFVYREAYYLGRAEPREGSEEHLKWQQDMDQLQHVAEVIIGKQRHGPIGTVKLSFDADTTRFGNLARDGRYDAYSHD